MNSFLGQAAAYVFGKHKLEDLQQIRVGLPSRRAALYFRNELAMLSSIPFFAPEISSIDDFIHGLSGLQPADPIDLYFQCFEIWKERDPGQSLEKFLTWAPTMIGDFDLIDAALLAHPNQLFHFMSAAEALKRWDLKDHTLSTASQEYFTFFDKMQAVYERLHVILPEKGWSYAGMAYRKAVDHIPEEGFYYFVGLNALSRAEEKIITSLVKAGRAECLWDSDNFYMADGNKAGNKLRDYKKTGQFGKAWNFEQDLLCTVPHDVYVYTVNTKVLQARLAVDLAARSTAQGHAMVVTDESDFTPLFVQLPGLEVKVNISAGTALKGTLLMASLEILFRFMEAEGEQIRRDFVRSALGDSLLKGAITREAGPQKVARWEKMLMTSTHLYLRRDELDFRGSELFQAILGIGDPKSFLLAVDQFLPMVMDSDSEDAPFATVLWQKLNRLKLRTTDELSTAAFRILFREVTSGISLPFEKQPAARLQVMSMLETRCLDFEEVTFLSFAEGSLPSGRKNNSFIPYDALKAFGLPSYSDQDAITAYHFFRLLQRARKVNIIYPEDTGTGVGRKERSRFLYQIEENLLAKNDKMRIFYPEVLVSDVQDFVNQGIDVKKTPEILHKIRSFLENKGLSATSLNEYFNGVPGFYWRHIESVKERVKDRSSIGHDIFGSMIHYVLEMTDKPYVGALITREILVNQKAFATEEFSRLVAENQPETDFTYGLNAVLKTLAQELVGKYYDKRLREFTQPFRIEALEQKFEAIVEYDGTPVKVRGIVDKIERHGDRIVVIDYKTGDVDAAKIRYPSGRDPLALKEYLCLQDRDKFRQLLLYKFLISEKFGVNANYEIKFYSFRKLDEDLILAVEEHTNEQVIEAVREMISRVVADLLDADSPIRQDPELQVPAYSDFANLLYYGGS